MESSKLIRILSSPYQEELRKSELFLNKMQNNYKFIWRFTSFLFNFITEVKFKAILILAIMNKFQKETLKMRLLKLASLKSTGAPAELALRFEISERSVKRIVRELREEGTNLRYSQARRSYVTEEDYQ
jgi:hypothetical protein